jgi:hypothetical protein
VECLLDFETKKSHNIIVKVTDDGKPSPTSAEMPLTIEIMNINDAPHSLMLSNNKVSELAIVDTVIGTPSATDQDKGQTLAFSVTGAATDTFGVKNGALVLKKAVDFEMQSLYKVTLLATDDGTPKMSVR